jgi:hypothetical protein
MYLALVSLTCFASDSLPIKSIIQRLAIRSDLKPKDRQDKRFVLVDLVNEPDNYRWYYSSNSDLRIDDYENGIYLTSKNRVIFSYLKLRHSKLRKMPILFKDGKTYEHFYKRYLIFIGPMIEANVEFHNSCPLYEIQESTHKFKLTFPAACNTDEFMIQNRLATLQFIVSANPFHTRPVLLSKDSNHAVEIIPKNEQSYRLMDDIVKKKKQNATKIKEGFLAIDMRDCFDPAVECETSCIKYDCNYCNK